jgi:SulP family sulfate permease
MLPPLSVIPPLVLPALALAFVGLVQGAGVSQNYANPDGKYPDLSGDFVGQGAANVFSGLFQGMPVGGSVSATSITVNAGARSRFANISAGLTMAVVIVLFGSAVGYIAMPAIGGLLIVIGFRTLKPHEVETVWKTGPIQQLVMVITFTFSLIIPLQHAVLIGVALSVVLFVVQQSNRITVKQWVVQPRGMKLEQDPPETVPSNQVTALAIYGSVFFANAALVEEQLPEVAADTRHAAVVLSLRAGEGTGSTFLEVLERYAISLREHQSRLILAAVTEEVQRQLTETGIARTIGRDNIFMHTERIGESFNQAWDAAEKWLAEQPTEVQEEAEVEEGVEEEEDAE